MQGYFGLALLWLLAGIVVGVFINHKIHHLILQRGPVDIARGYMWGMADTFRQRTDKPWEGKFRCKGCKAQLCGVCGSHFADSDEIRIDEASQDHEVADDELDALLDAAKAWRALYRADAGQDGYEASMRAAKQKLAHCVDAVEKAEAEEKAS
jgi:hypothetical protein